VYEALAAISAALILIALAGLGLSADVRAMLRVGPRPFLLGVGLWVAIVIVGLLLALPASAPDGSTSVVLGTMST
jgi:uncharacterized membrane protein YadS